MTVTRWIIILLCFLEISNIRANAGNANLVNNVFYDIVVAFSTDYVANINIDSAISQIEDLITETSSILYSATGGLLSFGNVTILIPPNWDTGQLSKKFQDQYNSAIPANPEMFDTADIRIDAPNTAYGSMPYTQQSRFCEESGDFIHLTSDFIEELYPIEEFGDPEQLLAREWVKYYFGVFDEQGYDFSNMYPIKYFAPGGQPILNICNTTGIDWRTCDCSGSSSMDGIPASCALLTWSDYHISTSIMSLPLTPVAAEFCSKENHNSDAPNKHNIMCDGKSVMEIVNQNPQFTSNFEKLTDDVPEISFQIKQLTSANAIALGFLWSKMDYQTSMSSTETSISKFVEYDFPSGGWLAVQGTGDTNSTWIQINSDNDRATILNDIANIATETVEIETIEALDILISSAEDLSDHVKAILVISFGTLSYGNWTTMCEMATENNFQLHSLSYDYSTTVNFLTNDNCVGKAIFIQAPDCYNYYYGSDADANDCCTGLQERIQMDNFLQAIPNTVAPNLYGPPKAYYENFLVDSIDGSFNPYINGYTDDMEIVNRFYFESCDSQVQCSVNGISCTYDSNYTDTNCADNVKAAANSKVNFHCSQSGQSPYSIYGNGQPVSSVVDPSIPSINLYAWTVIDEQTTYTRFRIFARLVYGTTPIFNAYVSATIVSDSKAVTVVLRDDGSGNPDVSAEDGVYSSYFTQFGSNSLYTVTVNAQDSDISESNSIEATYPTLQYPWLSGYNTMNEVPTGPFFRKVSLGTYYVDTSKYSAFPPGRTMDLHVNTSSTDKVVLQWTLPGEDLDYGTANKYYYKCSSYKGDLSPEYFTPTGWSYYLISNEARTQNSMIIYPLYAQATYYCAIITCDDSNLCSDISNIVTYGIYFPEEAKSRVVLWIMVSIGIFLFLVVILVGFIMIAYKKEWKRRPTNLPNVNRNSSDNRNDIPMETTRIGTRSDLDLPPSYEDAINTQPNADEPEPPQSDLL